jgi:hypothetical protein
MTRKKKSEIRNRLELRPDQKQAPRILARHVVSQRELRRRSRELAAGRQQGEQFKNDLGKVRNELAKARRELARGKTPKRPASCGKSNQFRK